MENQDHVLIEEKDIARYLHKALVDYGYAPGESEVSDLAEIFFDYLVDKSVFDGIEFDDSE